ncbi:MAG TPA: hypothetical protein VEA16_16195, partial [Vicinamibacterales bacterium]|nr:hypothetical protein [Vicinamibacterales bacterium]
DMDFGDIRNELGATARIESVESGGGNTRDAQLTVPAQRGADGWLYANVPLRPGGTFAVRNDRYEARGTVLAVETASPGATSK